jgi:hypothetical protein
VIAAISNICIHFQKQNTDILISAFETFLALGIRRGTWGALKSRI